MSLGWPVAINVNEGVVALPYVDMVIIIMVEIIVSIAGNETWSPLDTPRHGG
jgi:hypothetical protein